MIAAIGKKLRMPTVRSGQVLRVGFGASLLAIAGAVYGPNLIGTRSTDAIVNAPTIAVLSPIEGAAVDAPSSAGTAVHARDLLVEIRNPAIEGTSLSQLRTEARSLRERVPALEQLQADLTAQQNRLERDRRSLVVAVVARLEIVTKEGDAGAAAADAAATDADREWRRKQTLFASGAVSEPAVAMALNAAKRVRADAERAHHAADRMRQDLGAARGGVLVAEQPENTYMKQRIDEIAIRRAELAAQLREARMRLAEIEGALPAEEATLRARSAARLVAPVEAIVWRPMTFAGGRVVPGVPVMTLIDCAERVVQAKLSGRRFEAVYPGMAATVRLLGSDRARRAVVRDRRGMGASEQSDRFAAPVPVVGKDEFLVTLTLLDDVDPSGDGAAFCNVGRSVDVTFDGSAGPLAAAFDTVLRWVSFAGRAVAADDASGTAR